MRSPWPPHRLGRPPRKYQQPGLWWPALLLPDPVLDVRSGGRRDVGSFDVSIAQRASRRSFAGDHRYPADDLFHLTRLVGRRARRLHARAILSGSMSCKMAGSVAPHSITQYGEICC